jgi:hypothetical protein
MIGLISEYRLFFSILLTHFPICGIIDYESRKSYVKRVIMKIEKNYVKIDSRNRITIPKGMVKDLAHIYKIYEKSGNIILEPVMQVPIEERWLFDPQNKELVEELKKALKQKADVSINLDDLEK